MSTQTLSKPVDEFSAIVERSIEIDASPAAIFESILEDMAAIPDGKGNSMQLKVEAWPGGRWFRDLGKNAGHLWGHIQVIKPPTLLEVFGPLMISSAAFSHVSWRITPEGKQHRLTIKHKIFGDFDSSIPENVGGGWQTCLDRIKAGALKKK